MNNEYLPCGRWKSPINAGQSLQGHAGLLFDAIVGFDGFRLDDDGRVTSLEVLTLGGDRAGHVTAGEGETRRDKDAE